MRRKYRTVSHNPTYSHPQPDHDVRLSPRTSDLLIAAALFACSVPGSLITIPGHDLDVPWWPGTLLAGGSCVALVWRRRFPRATVVAAFACTAVAVCLGYLLTVLLLAPLMVALYSLAVSTDRRTANTFAFTSSGLLTITALLSDPSRDPLALKLLGPVAWLLLPTALGTVTRFRSAHLEAERMKAKHAEHTHEEEARRRVTEERMRIARDLHDVVAHHLVLANLHASALARSAPTWPEEVSRSADALTSATSSALRELRSTVHLLRHQDEEETVKGHNTSPPMPGLAQLDDLAKSFERAGLMVTIATEGEPRSLSSGVDLTAYRIVQEALTNVTRHSSADTAEIRLTYTDDLLTVTVTNSGTPTTSPSTTPTRGYGLMGMRERAHSMGGRTWARHCPTGGFKVVAELPQPSCAPQASP